MNVELLLLGLFTFHHLLGCVARQVDEGREGKRDGQGKGGWG